MSRTGFSRRDLVAIAVGGVLGAALRWWITKTPTPQDGGWFAYAPNSSAVEGPNTMHRAEIPWRTLTVNLFGTFLLGAVLVLRKRRSDAQRLWLALGTGFCGALTTFSTFAVDLAWLLSPARSTAFTVGTNMTGFEPIPDGGQILTLATAQSPTQLGLTYLALSLIGAAIAFVAGRFAARLAVAPAS